MRDEKSIRRTQSRFAAGLGQLDVQAVCLKQNPETERLHAILRNFPVIGHFRYIFEAVGPELRQYIVTSNNEEKPFSRDERRWVYASAKKQNNYFGFGTDHDLETSPNYLIIRHSAFPLASPQKGDDAYSETYALPAAKILGGARERAKAFRPDSVVNISGISVARQHGQGGKKCLIKWPICGVVTLILSSIRSASGMTTVTWSHILVQATEPLVADTAGPASLGYACR